MKRSDLSSLEHIKYYKYYIEKIPDVGIREALKHSRDFLIESTRDLKEEDADFKYEEGKWSIKELIMHLIDVERIFVYRALRMARNDFSKPLPFEQDDFVIHSGAGERTLQSILREFESQRQNTMDFFDNLTDEMLLRIEKKDGSRNSVRALGFFISGHELHHTEVLVERYLTKLNS